MHCNIFFWKKCFLSCLLFYLSWDELKKNLEAKKTTLCLTSSAWEEQNTKFSKHDGFNIYSSMPNTFFVWSESPKNFSVVSKNDALHLTKFSDGYVKPFSSECAWSNSEKQVKRMLQPGFIFVYQEIFTNSVVQM